MHALNGHRCSFAAIACALSLSMAACGGGASSAAPSGGAGSQSAQGGNSQSAGGNAQTGGGSTGPGKLSTASASVARRLSRAELSNLVRDALGDESGAPAKFLSEDQYRPFDNDYTVQSASSALIESLEATANDIASRAVLPENHSKIVPCMPAGPGDAPGRLARTEWAYHPKRDHAPAVRPL